MEQDNRIVVRLDLLKLPTGENHERALVIAEALLNICGVIVIWDEPKHGYRLFHVKTLPEDIPQAGIYWHKAEDIPVLQSRPFNKS